MREVRLFATKSRVVRNVVHRLQFVAGGADVVGWVEESGDFEHPERLCANSLFRCSLATGESERLAIHDVVEAFDGPLADPALSPDGRLLVTEVGIEDLPSNLLLVRDQLAPDEYLPEIETAPIGFAGLLFTPDGSALVVVCNGLAGEEETRAVVRFDVTPLTASAARYRTRRNPLTNQTTRVPVRNLKQKVLIARPGWARATAAALSANGRFLAVVDETGAFHIADLKAKRVLASLPPEAEMRLDPPVRAPRRRARILRPQPLIRPTVRLAFDPQAKWLVRLAGGKLFARTLAGGKAWQTPPDFGHVHDFAFHPSGRVLCAVCADGRARTLDPRTGAPLQTFKWGKKPLYSVAYSPDGLTCAAGAENGRVVVWDVDL